MIVISNNIIGKMPIPEDAIIRINLAWIDNLETATRLLNESNHQIYLDYPDGRKKPPRPTITLDEAIELSRHKIVKYFAISNAEDIYKIKGIMSCLDDVEFVPKIETVLGVKNMSKMKDLGIKMFMLDKEDLYTDVDCDGDRYNELVNEAMKHEGVISLQGVIFG